MATVNPDNGTTYPTTLDAYAETADSADLAGGVILDHATAINAMQEELGSQPSGSFDTVADRLDNLLTPTDPGRAGSQALTDGLSITDATAQAANHTFMLGPRTTTALAYPVPVFQPKVAAKPIAFDVAPSSGATDSGNNGVAWIDVCDTPIIDDAAGNLSTLRLGMRATAGFAEISTRIYGTGANRPLYLSSGYSGSGQPQLLLTTNGASYVWAGGDGSDVILGLGAAQSTTSTTGYMFVPVTAGTPTGVPARYTSGRAALIWDSTGNKLWSYSGGTWRSVTFT